MKIASATFGIGGNCPHCPTGYAPACVLTQASFNSSVRFSNRERPR